MREWLLNKYNDKAELFDVLYYKILPFLSDAQLCEIFAEELKEEEDEENLDRID